MANKQIYSTGQLWGALRKNWTGYKIAKVEKDKARMEEYATRIHSLQEQLNLKRTVFKRIKVD